MDFYWEITEYDGTVTKIPPASVEVVKKRWGNGDPIHTSVRSIPARQIKSFRITAERFTDRPLIEAAAQAFKEPIVTTSEGNGIEYEAIEVKWVKQTVTMDRWTRHYSVSPGYKSLGDMNGMVIIAFRIPTHEVNLERVDYCNDEEVERLTRQ